jgi:hypothetical protein
VDRSCAENAERKLWKSINEPSIADANRVGGSREPYR